MSDPEPSVRFSAIVTAHGRARFLESAVRSVLSQTVPRSEIQTIVTKDFAHPFVDSLPDVRVLDSSGSGVGAMMADALDEATGEVVAFLDDDDLWSPDKLSHVRAAFASDPALAYYAHGFSAIDERDRPIKADRPTLRRAALLSRPMQVDVPTASRDLIARASEVNPGASFIAIRRETLAAQEPFLRRITAVTDQFLFWSGVLSRGHLVFTATRDGLLRAHSENYSRPPKSSFATYRARYAKMQRQHTESFRILREMVEGDPRFRWLVERELARNAHFRDVAEGSATRREMLRSLFDSADDPLAERISKALYVMAPRLAQVANFLNGMARW